MRNMTAVSRQSSSLAQDSDTVESCPAMSDINENKEMTQTASRSSVHSMEMEMDVTNLRRVPGSIPKTALLILLVEVRQPFEFWAVTNWVASSANDSPISA